MSTATGKNPAPSTAGARRPTIDNGPIVRLKVATPDLYYGGRDKLEDQLLQLQLYFAFQGSDLPEEQQPVFAISYLRGRAQRQVNPSLKRYLEDPDNKDNEEIKRQMTSFARFRVEIRRILGNSNETSAAVRIIQHLRQKTSASEYATQFQQYAT